MSSVQASSSEWSPVETLHPASRQELASTAPDQIVLAGRRSVRFLENAICSPEFVNSKVTFESRSDNYPGCSSALDHLKHIAPTRNLS